jgi:hypothetical protein
MTTALDDPRVSSRPERCSDSPADTEYFVDTPSPAEVNPSHLGYSVHCVGDGWSRTETRTGWVVFNSFGCWINSVRPPTDREHEIDAKDVYPTAEDAISAVLAALDGR